MLSRIVRNPWFSLFDLFLVALSGVVWVFVPKLGIWFTLIALLPWGLRLLVKETPFQRTPFDWPIAIFSITAWIGYWAAYDKTTAWVKAWLIITAILLYYALSAQPKQNFATLSLVSFCLGVVISIYFFLTHDFAGSLGGIASWWMNHRLHSDWPPIQRGFVSELLVVPNLFAFYWVRKTLQKPFKRFTIPLVVLGLATVTGALVLTISRGTLAAIASGLGVWILWRITNSNQFVTKPGVRSLFPLFVLIYLCAIIAFVYIGPARAGENSNPSNYGENTRAELFERGTSFLLDFPITGGGLNSFPGLYSQYIIVIPIFYFINSYNLFLDVAIEQGLIGGVAFIFIYMGSIWLVSRAIANSNSQRIRFFSWLGLFALVFSVVHGLFYDYLYSGSGTMLLFLPVGFSMIGILGINKLRDNNIWTPVTLPSLSKIKTLLIIIPLLGIITLSILNVNKIISIWYSNLGAVQMSQVELRDFPTNQWSTTKLVPQLEQAATSFRTSLQYNPDNQTANFRLGMIAMLRQDFESAARNLEAAYHKTPSHRGIIKNLGYCYAWLGEMDKAKMLLERIPESPTELGVYTWWWDTQGRGDLSRNASLLLPQLKFTDIQP